MKDETERVLTDEFFGLKSKIYSYIKGDDIGDKKAKRIIMKTLLKTWWCLETIKIGFLKRDKWDKK